MTTGAVRWIGLAATRAFACLVLSVVFGSPANAGAAGAVVAPDWSAGRSSADMLVVAIAAKADPVLAAGATPRGYVGLPDYSGSERSAAAAARLARKFGLREVAAWTIDPLRLRCMVFQMPQAADRDELIARLARDPRVRIAQPLQDFETLSVSNPVAVEAPMAAPAAGYNDPYVELQRNFARIGGAAAQRWTRGAGTQIAIVDTGIDASHPDLQGRLIGQADFVGAGDRAATTERHATEVAGVIAAVANNRIGIVGVAPEARLFGYRACWALHSDASRARCNSYTLALALAAAMDSDARIINLSLGGPRDPLLEQLLGHALANGRIVVGAIPPSGRSEGFPTGVRGVIAVASTEDPPSAGETLTAPGRDILTLLPGGGFDYASGSSLAAAQVSGAIALLLALKPHLHAAALQALLRHSQAQPGASINACVAVREVRGRPGACATSDDALELSAAKP